MDTESVRQGTDNPIWENILKRVKLEVFNQESSELRPTTTLTLDGLTHLIGMVSSGKSTLMDVLAVWASRKGMRVTLIVGDVMNALNRARQFVRLGLNAAPILGRTNRERHTNRLHRVLAAENPSDSPLQHEHVGFRWLSTACPLDGLRDTSQPLQADELPCLKKLCSLKDAEKPAKTRKYHACPIYNACPFHQAQRELVGADIWIATPGSLVYTPVAHQLNTEHIRFAELVCRRSDLVIVDEADQVQVQLDMTFSPNQTLVSRGQDAWLSGLSQQVVTELNREGRGQLADENVDTWVQAHDTAQRVTSKMYGLLLREPALRKWVVQGQYFTDWLLFDKLANGPNGLIGKKSHSPDN